MESKIYTFEESWFIKNDYKVINCKLKNTKLLIINYLNKYFNSFKQVKCSSIQ